MARLVGMKRRGVQGRGDAWAEAGLLHVTGGERNMVLMLLWFFRAKEGRAYEQWRLLIDDIHDWLIC